MSDIAIFHPEMMASGGGERVCANVIVALESEHQITVYTTSQVNLDKFANFHNVDISEESINVIYLRPFLNSLLDLMSTCVSTISSDSNLERLRTAVARNGLEEELSSNHDLIISTRNELKIDLPSIQYIHFPTFTQTSHGEIDPRSSSLAFKTYYILCSKIVQHSSPKNTNTISKTLANSSWTAKLVSQSFDPHVQILHPPVNVREFAPPPWEEQNCSFVSIGRIHPLKNQVKLIEIIEDVRNYDFNPELHIIGPVGDEKYEDRVRNLSDSRDYIHYHGKVNRDKLVNIVEQCRFGIHGRECEHFGIAVAEIAAGGAIPFVPNSGGQTDIVNNNHLTYDSRSDAVNKICNIMENSKLQREILADIERSTNSYSKNEFRVSIKKFVETVIGDGLR